MKKILLSVLVLLVLVAVPATASAFVLMEAYNETDTSMNGTWYATQVTLRYIPQDSYDLARVEFYTGGQKDDVTISLRPDANNYPSTTILASGLYDSTGSGLSWQGATFDTPYSVVAGQTYWVTWYNTSGLLAPYATTGTTRYVRWGEGSNINSYPNIATEYGFKTKFYGNESETVVPEPASMALLGLGLVGILRKKKKVKV